MEELEEEEGDLRARFFVWTDLVVEVNFSGIWKIFCVIIYAYMGVGCNVDDQLCSPMAKPDGMSATWATPLEPALRGELMRY